MNISKLPPAIPTAPAKKRVAAYARVSSKSQSELDSLFAQTNYYTEYIRTVPEWDLVGIYADYGVSGTSTRSRSEFRRLMSDCESGKIDIILTKSISRFARNTVDLIAAVRRLSDLGVEVRFERERIRSLDSEGELMLTILSSFAQEESRSISENIKWGIRRGFEQGKTNTPVLFGYRSVQGELFIEPREAEIVRQIFSNYLSGKPISQTLRELKAIGAKTRRGNDFSRSSIYDILHQEKYTGSLTLQKYYIEDHMTHKKRKNLGQKPQYIVKDSHEPIIEKAVFDQVQKMIKARRESGIFASKAVKTSCFTSRLLCELCGKFYRRYGRYDKQNTRQSSDWCCSTRKKPALSCAGRPIPEQKLKAACAYASGDNVFIEENFIKMFTLIIVKPLGELEFVSSRNEPRLLVDWRNF